METTTALLLLALTLIVYLINKLRNVYAYFAKRGVPYVKPYFLLGSDPKLTIMRKSLCDGWDDMYKRLDGHKIGGFFNMVQPYYVVRDPEFVQKVFTSDFSHFTDRGIKIDEEVNPLDAHLFLLSGWKWRFMRNKLSPIFTTGKLRWMYDEMETCIESFMENFKGLKNKELDLKEDFARLTTDVIGSCAFGIDSQALSNPNSEFRAVGKRIFQPTLAEGGKFILRLAMPDLFMKLKLKSSPDEVTNFYSSIIKQAFEHRKKTGEIRKDMVQLLLELREKGSVNVDQEDAEELKENSFTKYSKESDNSLTLELNDNLFAAQSFVFLVAGFETTASTLHFVTYLLSKNPSAQEKARAEVKKVIAKHGKLNFEAVKEMQYLEKCISETLRLFPPVPHLFRECTKSFEFPDGTRIEKGANLIIPIFSLQRDPKYFPEPEKFIPERFDNPPIKGTYAPFGEGPRICIGKRFALIEVKLALARILDKYKFQKSEKAVDKIRFQEKVFTIASKDPLYVKVKPL